MADTLRENDKVDDASSERLCSVRLCDTVLLAETSDVPLGVCDMDGETLNDVLDDIELELEVEKVVSSVADSEIDFSSVSDGNE